VFGADRRATLWTVGAVAGSRRGHLPGTATGTAPPPLPAQTIEKRTIGELWAGPTAGVHPMLLVRERLAAAGVTAAAELPSLRRGQPVTVAGLVTQRQHPANTTVTFLGLEDHSGLINVIVPAKTWAAQPRKVKQAGALITAARWRTRTIPSASSRADSPRSSWRPSTEAAATDDPAGTRRERVSQPHAFEPREIRAVRGSPASSAVRGDAVVVIIARALARRGGQVPGCAVADQDGAAAERLGGPAEGIGHVRAGEVGARLAPGEFVGGLSWFGRDRAVHRQNEVGPVDQLRRDLGAAVRAEVEAELGRRSEHEPVGRMPG
jgi:hypothetical protein